MPPVLVPWVVGNSDKVFWVKNRAESLQLLIQCRMSIIQQSNKGMLLNFLVLSLVLEPTILCALTTALQVVQVLPQFVIGIITILLVQTLISWMEHWLEDLEQPMISMLMSDQVNIMSINVTIRQRHVCLLGELGQCFYGTKAWWHIGMPSASYWDPWQVSGSNPGKGDVLLS